MPIRLSDKEKAIDGGYPLCTLYMLFVLTQFEFVPVTESHSLPDLFILVLL